MRVMAFISWINLKNPKCGIWTRNFFLTTSLDLTHGQIKIIRLYDIKNIFS